MLYKKSGKISRILGKTPRLLHKSRQIRVRTVDDGKATVIILAPRTGGTQV